MSPESQASSEPLTSVDDLVSTSREIDTEQKRIAGEQARLKDERTSLSTRKETWQTNFNRTREAITDGTISTGDPEKNYVLAHTDSYPDKFSTRVEEEKAKLSGFLDKLRERKTYWHKSREWSPTERDVYQIGFLKDRPIEVTPTEIRINANRIVTISLERLFREDRHTGGTLWPFVEEGESGTMQFKGRIIELSDDSCDFDSLIDSVKYEPDNVRDAFLRAVGQGVPPELAAKEQTLIHDIATKAVKKLEKEFNEIKKADRKIGEIFSRVNTEEIRSAGMYATRPVMPVVEYDSFLAAIDSASFHDDKKWALDRLRDTLRDMHRTGILQYKDPIVVRVREGKDTIYRIPEFAGNIMYVLEERISPPKVAAGT